MKDGWVMTAFCIGFIVGACAVAMTPSLTTVSGKSNSAMTVEYKDVVYRLVPLETK